MSSSRLYLYAPRGGGRGRGTGGAAGSGVRLLVHRIRGGPDEILEMARRVRRGCAGRGVLAGVRNRVILGAKARFFRAPSGVDRDAAHLGTPWQCDAAPEES